MSNSLNHSPEIVFGQWLMRIAGYMQNHHWGMENEDETSRGLLACILELGEQHSKLFELFDWLQSKNGQEFLDQDQYQPAGAMIYSQVETFIYEANRLGYLNKNINESTKEEITIALREFIADNKIHLNPKPSLT